MGVSERKIYGTKLMTIKVYVKDTYTVREAWVIAIGVISFSYSDRYIKKIKNQPDIPII
jgi:nucleoside recognition membrane protein YjiH